MGVGALPCPIQGSSLPDINLSPNSIRHYVQDVLITSLDVRVPHGGGSRSTWPWLHTHDAKNSNWSKMWRTGPLWTPSFCLSRSDTKRSWRGTWPMVTMREVDYEGRMELIPCKVEEREPEVFWNEVYRISRLYGLSPQSKSFLFRLIYTLLPSRERVHNLTPSTSLLSWCRAGMHKNYVPTSIFPLL